MKFKIGFSWIGFIIAVLPLFINIVYALVPPTEQSNATSQVNKIVDLIEQVTRVLFLILICVLVCTDKVNWKNPCVYIALIFLVLYHIVWIRYFVGGRTIDLMSANFGFVPIPLAVFPVLYYIFGALWLQNYIAAGVMAVFGVAHYIVSYQSFLN